MLIDIHSQLIIGVYANVLFLFYKLFEQNY